MNNEQSNRRAEMLANFCKDFGNRSDAMKIAGGIVVAAIIVAEAIEHAAETKQLSESP